jgi:two-component sensor histidine kinase
MATATQAAPPKLPWSQRLLWLATQSRASAIATAIVLAAFGFCVKFLFELWLDQLRLSALQADIIDSSVSSSILAAALLSILLSAVSRRKHVQEELARVGELNHHVRNGLQVILSREHCRSQRSQEVIEAVKRIERTIRALYPVPGTDAARSSRLHPQTDTLPLSQDGCNPMQT